MENTQSSEFRQLLEAKFVQIQVELQVTGPDLRDCIEAQLNSHGQPLRWAITAVEGTTAYVEAMVTFSTNTTNNPL